MKIKNIFQVVIICSGMLFSFSCYGQSNNQNIPLGALPMQYNGSFAGEAGASRISSSAYYYKYNNNTFQTGNRAGIYTSYDQFFKSIGTGIGVTTGYHGSNDNWPFSNGQIFFSSLAVAPKISIKGKYTLSPSIDISRLSGNFYNNEFYINRTELQTSINSKAGLLFNTQKYYIGYSVYLLNQEKTIYDISFRNPRRFRSFLQFGYSFRRTSESKFSFTPQFVLSLSEKRFPEEKVMLIEAVNLTFRYSQYIAGINNTGFHLGIQKEGLRVVLSSRIGLSTSYEPYSGNLSFRYIFKNTDKPGAGSSRF